MTTLMDETTQMHLENMRSKDKDLQNAAFAYLMAATAVTKNIKEL